MNVFVYTYIPLSSCMIFILVILYTFVYVHDTLPFCNHILFIIRTTMRTYIPDNTVYIIIMYG